MTAADYVRNPDMRVLLAIAGVARKYGRTWCYPSQDTLTALIERFTERHLSRRHLNRHLGALERDKWIERRRRHRSQADGSLELRSTVYTLTKRALRWLRNIGANVDKLSTALPNYLTFKAVTDTAQSALNKAYLSNHGGANAPPLNVSSSPPLRDGP